MKKNITLSVILIALCAGCVSGNRGSLVEHANYNNGKSFTFLHPRLPFGLADVKVLEIKLGVVNTDSADVVVSGGSILSKTGLAGLAANTTTTRNGSNAVDTVGYDIKELNTDVSTNAPATIGAGGTAIGNIIKESLRPSIP